jgi:hypothetical protein
MVTVCSVKSMFPGGREKITTGKGPAIAGPCPVRDRIALSRIPRMAACLR